VPTTGVSKMVIRAGRFTARISGLGPRASSVDRQPAALILIALRGYAARMDAPIGAVTAVMHDTVDLDVAVAFWTRILGLEVQYRDDRYAYLSGLSADGPRLAFQKVPEPKVTKNRLHLDVRVADRIAFQHHVESLGGSVVEVHEHPGWPVWTVMTDPQGNEFCIYERS
jgi:predicted enzyme related to lactoylglutathione lyase